jgi:hypothetical protein
VTSGVSLQDLAALAAVTSSGILREMRDELAGSAAEHDGGPGRARDAEGLAAGETVVRRVWSLFGHRC